MQEQNENQHSTGQTALIVLHSLVLAVSGLMALYLLFLQGESPHYSCMIAACTAMVIWGLFCKSSWTVIPQVVVFIPLFILVFSSGKSQSALDIYVLYRIFNFIVLTTPVGILGFITMLTALAFELPEDHSPPSWKRRMLVLAVTIFAVIIVIMGEWYLPSLLEQ